MSSQWAGGKGSARRPMAVDKEVYEDNWDKIFKKKDYNKSEEEWDENPELCSFHEVKTTKDD